jgi:GH24 family phage-related lysozyme (muramidase)
MDTGRFRRRRLPKVTTEVSGTATETSEQTTPEITQAEEEMTSTFSGGNISQRRLDKLTLPSDTPASLVIKRFENFNPVANWDVRQNTNGFGTQALNANEEITMEVAQERLMAIITRDTNSIKSFDEEHGYNFTENEVVGLVSFMFNLGPGSLNQVTANGTRSKEETAAKMLEYVNAGGRRLRGLVKRRQDEYDIFTGKVNI